MVYDMRWRNTPDQDGAHFRLNEAAMAQYIFAMRVLGMVHGPDIVTPLPQSPEGIPAFKFSGNGGWHVAADECRAALAAYRSADAHRTQWVHREVRWPWNPNNWQEWIAFLEGAVDRGGFRVN